MKIHVHAVWRVRWSTSLFIFKKQFGPLTPLVIFRPPGHPLWVLFNYFFWYYLHFAIKGTPLLLFHDSFRLGIYWHPAPKFPVELKESLSLLLSVREAWEFRPFKVSDVYYGPFLHKNAHKLRLTKVHVQLISGGPQNPWNLLGSPQEWRVPKWTFPDLAIGRRHSEPWVNPTCMRPQGLYWPLHWNNSEKEQRKPCLWPKLQKTSNLFPEHFPSAFCLRGSLLKYNHGFQTEKPDYFHLARQGTWRLGMYSFTGTWSSSSLLPWRDTGHSGDPGGPQKNSCCLPLACFGQEF